EDVRGIRFDTLIILARLGLEDDFPRLVVEVSEKRRNELGFGMRFAWPVFRPDRENMVAVPIMDFISNMVSDNLITMSRIDGQDVTDHSKQHLAVRSENVPGQHRVVGIRIGLTAGQEEVVHRPHLAETEGIAATFSDRIVVVLAGRTESAVLERVHS